MRKQTKVNDFILVLGVNYHDILWPTVYTDESALIAKNTSLIVARVPVAGATNKKIW